MTLAERVSHLRPPLDTSGPRVRLGIVWGVVAGLAAALGALPAALVTSGVALGASGQACRAWRRHGRHPNRIAAIGASVLVTLSASAGAGAMVAAVCFVVAVAAGTVVLRPEAPRRDARLAAAIGIVVGVASAGLPLARHELGATPALVLLATVLVGEASWFIIGSDARRRFEAAVASSAAIGVVGLATASVLVPPFRGASPWVLAAVGAVLVPLGPPVASTVLPRPDARVPALRRVDGFLLVAPVWVLVGSALLELA
ncbi:MAG TPA: hypothetical protein VFV35_06770 [Acidimicrobiales bacterium]|nr:hypothetical protein [Acidimicrobiales bacterium]